MIVVIRPIVDAAAAWTQPLNFGPADQAYVERLIHEGRAAEARTARYALMDALALRFQRHDLEWVIERGELGAPSLTLATAPSHLAPASSNAGRRPQVPAISLAHTELAAVAATSPARCGVDIEANTRTRIQNAWKRVSTPQEHDWMLSLRPSRRARYAILAWTLKESWSKLTGDGLVHRGLELLVEPLDDGSVHVHAPIELSAFTTEFGGHTVSLLVEGHHELSSLQGTEAAWIQLVCKRR